MIVTTQLRTRTTRHKFERCVAAAARAQRLFERGDHILVAVSGGPDSVALLTALASLAPSWRLTLSALHVNYGLRGEESEDDARFVSRLCADLGVPLICERVVLRQMDGTRTTVSLQARAREVRYAALRRAAAALGAGKIALGHTADDQAETLVMWMLRGSGVAGLAGIRPVREAVYVRPLLGIGRADVLAYLTMKGVGFRMDSSNAKPLYLRNRVRHDLLPLLKQFNPAVVDALTRQAAILRDEDLCLQQWTSEWIMRHVERGEDRTITVPHTALSALPIALQRRVVRQVMQQVTGSAQGPAFGAAEAVLEKIVRGRTGSSLAMRGARVAREYETIRFSPGRDAHEHGEGAVGAERDRAAEVSLRSPSTTVWSPTGQAIRLTLADVSPTDASAGRHGARFDADRFTHRLVLRSWKPGDVFCPDGMGGRRKKIQDYFCDRKLPRGKRTAVPLLVAPEGILWVVGYRADHRFRVTAATRRVLVADVVPAETIKGSEG